MCGRYSIANKLSLTPEQVRSLQSADYRDVPPPNIQHDLAKPISYAGEAIRMVPNYDIRPTQPDLPFYLEDGMQYGRWGMVPSWWKKPLKDVPASFNAKSERLTESGMWRGPFKHRRCVVPMSGFYEWQYQADGKTTVRHFIRLKDPGLFGCAGLWDEWKQPDGTVLKSFTIITCPANPLMAKIHNKPGQEPRMPVILDVNSAGEWVDQSYFDGVDHVTRLTPRLQPYLAEGMVAYPVNSRPTKTADLMVPIGEPVSV